LTPPPRIRDERCTGHLEYRRCRRAHFHPLPNLHTRKKAGQAARGFGKVRAFDPAMFDVCYDSFRHLTGSPPPGAHTSICCRVTAPGGMLHPTRVWSFHGDSDPSEHNQQRRPTSEMAESGRISTVFLVSPRERRRVWGRRECKPTGAPVSGRVGEPSSRTVEIASAEFVGAGLRRPLLRAPVSSSQCSSKKTTGAGNE